MKRSRGHACTLALLPALALINAPAQAQATLIINGNATPADVRPLLGGAAYVRLSDVAKALGLTVVHHGTSYELIKAGGANQVEGLSGKIGDTLFDGRWRFQVQSVEMPDAYTAKFLEGGNSLNFDRDTHVVRARPGYRMVVVHCRMTNGQKSMQTFWFAQASEMHVNNSLTDTSGESYPPDLFDVEGDSDDQSKPLLPGAKTDFAMLFSVPAALQREDLKDLVFTLRNNNSSQTGKDVRVSLKSP